MDPLTNSQIIQLWQAYQGVAMHFNELILQYRLTLMGGLGAAVSILFYISRTKITENAISNKINALPTILSFCLLVIFSSAASLDYFYYNDLLLGAVEEIIRFESQYPELNFSTTIAGKFGGGPSRVIPDIYSILFILLIINLCVQACRYYCAKNETINNSDSK